MKKYRETGFLKMTSTVLKTMISIFLNEDNPFLEAAMSLIALLTVVVGVSESVLVDESKVLLLALLLAITLATHLTATKIHKKYCVYLSYSHNDKEPVKNVLELIEQRLRRNTFQKLTVLTDDEISVGDNIIETVTSFVKKSERVFIFISKSYIESESCYNELSLCMKVAAKKIIPIYLESPNSISNLPEELKNIKPVILDERCDAYTEIDKIIDVLIKK